MAQTMPNFGDVYRDYLQAIVREDPSPDWLDDFVHPEVIHNSRLLGIEKYKELIRTNIVKPQTSISLEKLVVATDHITARLRFTVPSTCSTYLGHELVPYEERRCHSPSGQIIDRVDKSFDVYENVIYHLVEHGGAWKIKEVWSVADLEPVRQNALQKHSG